MDQNYTPNPFSQQDPHQQDPSYTTPSEPEVKSYTASPYDRYQTPCGEQETPAPSPAEPARKPVSLITAMLISAIVSSITGLLVFSVILYGSGLGDVLRNQDTTSYTESQTGEQTTNIVVDTSASTSAEAVATKAGPSVVGIVVTGSYYNIMTTGSEGSGIIYSQDGYIITNYHVIQSAQSTSGSVEVYLPSDTKTGISAAVVGYDISSDLAVLKIKKEGLPAMELADSDQLKVGQTAIAIGNPGGMDFMGSVSMGIISGLDRTLQLENAAAEINLIQTDAAINPGNSGGALVNAQGQLIGINSAKMATDNYEGMGFAIPINDAKTIIDRIIQNQDATQAYIGIMINTQYDTDTLNRMGLPAGIVIDSVAANSPAYEAGLQAYDIITHIEGVAVKNYEQFSSEKAKYQPGETIELTLYRNGRTYETTITLGASNQ